MLNCFAAEQKNCIPIFLISANQYNDWLSQQKTIVKNWLSATKFRAKLGQFSCVPNPDGTLFQIICCTAEKESLWSVGHLPMNLPQGAYQFICDEKIYAEYAIGWALGAYQFTRYKKSNQSPAKLYIPSSMLKQVENIANAIGAVRDWINTPTDDMGPSEFAVIVKQMAAKFDARFKQIVGADLLKKNYASIYTVGRASDDPPRLLDLRWGKAKHPKITLVGKGVCFDSGGLDIKPSSYMALMKKDMAGGAHVLGLAQMMMQAKLPVCLRVLIPVVENVISGNAYRPGDIIKSRKGMTIEIGNTDSEGRVILADALTEAVSEQPELLIDITTLTGAARVALGTELPAVFSNHDQIVADVIREGEKNDDLMWRLPLYAPYLDYLASAIANINNNSSEPYGGAITGALFLKEFVPDHIPWLHFDLMAWNLRYRPGRPQGGEAMVLRALFAYLKNKYSQS